MTEISTKELSDLLITTNTVRDDAILKIAKLRKLISYLFLFISIGFAVTLILLLFSTHVSEKVSCQRSNVVRYSQLGEYQYAIDAADARIAAYKIQIKEHQYALAKINLVAAHKFQIDAKRIHVVLIPCTGLFPSAV